jgi:hypothetical protein
VFSIEIHKMPLDLNVLNTKDPMGLETEQLLKSGHQYPLNRKQQRIEERNRSRKLASTEDTSKSFMLINDPRMNRNKRSEVEKYKANIALRAEKEIDEAYGKRLEDRNLPMVKKTEKNREKRLRKKLKQKLAKEEISQEAGTESEVGE